MTNLVLHAVNATLVWLLLRKIGVQGAMVAAALFAVHPVNVESVVWIYERKNVLSGLFYFLTFAALFRFEERRSWRWYRLDFVSVVQHGCTDGTLANATDVGTCQTIGKRCECSDFLPRWCVAIEERLEQCPP